MIWKTTMRKVGNNGKQTTIPKKILDELGEGNVIWKYENGRVYIEVEKQLNLSIGDMVNVEIMGKKELGNDDKMNLREE